MFKEGNSLVAAALIGALSLIASISDIKYSTRVKKKGLLLIKIVINVDKLSEKA